MQNDILFLDLPDNKDFHGIEWMDESRVKRKKGSPKAHKRETKIIIIIIIKDLLVTEMPDLAVFICFDAKSGLVIT